mgnify:CR=1 FL=1
MTFAAAAPGYLFALSYSLAAVMLSLVNPPKGKFSRRLTLWLLLPAASAHFSHLTDFKNDLFYFPLLFIAIAFAVLILFFSCSIPLKNAVYFGFYAFLIGEFITSLFWQVHLYVCARYPFQPVMPYVGYFGTCLVCLGILYWYERRYAEQNAQLQLSWKMLITTALTAVGVFLFSNVSNVFRDTPFSGQTSLQINLIRLLVDAAGFFLLETNRMVRDEEAKRAELTLLRRLMEQQYENYQASEQSMALVHQKYHDLKHQIAFLREDINSEEKMKYLDRMEDEIRSFEARAKTGNRVMDTVLTAKSLQCQSLGIILTVSADGRLLDFMDPVDLSALLGNLLDNAIEHVSQIQDKEKRWIQFQLRRRNDFVVLSVGNHCLEAPNFQNGLPLTTKQDKRFHGFGVRSIRETAKAYGGSASFSAENGWFEAKLLFVQPAQKAIG